MPEFQIPDFTRAFPGLQSLLLWLSCIAVAVSVLATLNVFTLRRPFIGRCFVAALLAYLVAAPCLFKLREFTPTMPSIAVHVGAYTVSVACLWLIFFQPGRQKPPSAAVPNRYLW